MDHNSTALFLLTGLFSACGARSDQLDNKDQRTEAMLAALSISHHYPDSPFAQSADLYIEIMQERYLEDQ
ncbi:MAG TPA: hypothetical protein VK112_04185 [Fodinibius sp.]|nr:hypothetical protein [Fodinibius sp.]